jgi:16S rRNA (uracil1498-N3)-methyltransferase
MRRFLVEQLAPVGGLVTPGADVARHLAVIHIRRGERVILFDGGPLEAVATVVDPHPPLLQVDDVRPASRARADVHLLIGLPKGPAMDLAIRMATEAGVTHLHPVASSRAVPKGDRVDRWERIAESAAEQCGRADVPAILPLRSLPEALDALPSGIEVRVATPGAPRLSPTEGAAAVLIGPEGGLTEQEVELAQSRGARPMGLGPFVLRTETAAAVAVAMVVGG